MRPTAGAWGDLPLLVAESLDFTAAVPVQSLARTGRGSGADAAEEGEPPAPLSSLSAPMWLPADRGAAPADAAGAPVRNVAPRVPERGVPAAGAPAPTVT